MSATMQNNRRRNSNKSHVYNNNRAGYPSNNYGGRRETPEPETQSSSPVRGVYGDAQTAIVMCSILGTQTTVKTRNNSIYKGHTTGFSEKGDIAMRDVKLESGQDEHITEDSNLPGIIVPKDAFVVCATYGVDMKGLCSGQDFTDSSIASKLNGSTDSPLRELQPWHDDDAPEIDIELDGKSSGWEPSEMFQVNSEKFHVKSSYSEDLLEYTTKLPTPGSESYEEKLRFAEKHAAEIERSVDYQNRISKELSDGDEESKYSSVHRDNHRSHESNSSGKNVYTIPALRGESDTGLRNGNHSRNQGRGNVQRQNSPYTSNHGQHHAHSGLNSRQDIRSEPRQDARQMNNHYHQSPAVSSSGSLHRTPGSSGHQRQTPSTQNNHASPSNSHQFHQQSSPGIQSNNSSPQNQQHRAPLQPSSMPPSHQNKQHQSSQQQANSPVQSPASSVKIVQSPQTKPVAGSPRQHIQQPVNSEPTNTESSQKPSDPTPSQAYHKQDQGDGPSIPFVPKGSEGMNPPAAPVESDSQSVVVADSSSTSVTSDRRLRVGVDSSPDDPSRTNKVKQLQEFHQNFNLDSQSSSSAPDDISADTPTSTTVPSASSSAVSSASVSQVSEPALKLKEDEDVQKSKLNPNAKEFKPSTAKTFVPQQPMEAQSPSPQSRSPHYIQQVAHYPYPHPQSFLPVGIPTPVHTAALLQPMPRKKATVSVGPVNDHLTAHQVTGQPLMATQSVLFPIPQPQGMPQSYQVINMGNPPTRMMNHNSLVGQGQHQNIEQAGTQNQPQPVFMPQQIGAIPAHLPPHPQPAHAHSTSSQPQTVHAPNPAPSPVQHPPQQMNGQPVPHHISQGPPQSVTPQPQHYQQMNAMHGNMQQLPRTSMASQQHQVSQSHQVSYPMSMSTPQYSYPTASAAQYTYAPAPQPQTSQNSSHGPGPQPQYVVMPQPGHQGPPMQQQTGQPYPGAGIHFQAQHNLMPQGPPQMPPNHGHNPAQGAPHLIHSGMQGMPGLHPQVSGTPPGMFMPGTMPQVYMSRDGRSNTAVPAPTAIMFALP